MKHPVEGAMFQEMLAAGQLGEPWTVEEARQKLRDGNAKYMASHKEPERNLSEAHLKAYLDTGGIKGEFAQQRPFAVVLCCADSRVSPEIVFAQEQGMLFVIRTAGNTSDPKVVANIAYALHALEVPLLVVMGHQECGAVGAAINQKSGLPANKLYAAFVDPILKSVKPVDGRPQSAVWENGVRQNIRSTAEELMNNVDLHVKGVTPTIDRIYYHFDTGQAEVF